MKIFFISTLLIFTLQLFAAELKEVNYDTNKPWVKSRELFESKPKNIPNDMKALFEAKRSQLSGNYKSCLNNLNKALKVDHGLENWILSEKLFCQNKIFRSSTKTESGNTWILLKKTLPAWDSQGPHRNEFRKRWTDLALPLFQMSSRMPTKIGWEQFFALKDKEKYLSSSQMADLYQWAGEMALIENKKDVALDYFEKSYEASESTKLKDKLNGKILSLRSALNITEPPKLVVDEAVLAETAAASEEEDKLFQRYKESLNQRDIVATAEDGIKFLNTYPKSNRSQEVEQRVIRLFLSVAQNQDEKLRMLRAATITEMQKADPERLLSWVKSTFDRELYENVILLTSELNEKGEDRATTSALILYRGNSFYQLANFEKAKETYLVLTKAFAETDSGIEAKFRLGLVNYRLNDFASSRSNFSSFVESNINSSYRLPAIYWLYRAQMKSELPDAKKTKQLLLDEFPLSYFGIRLAIEDNEGKLNFPLSENNKNKIDSWKFHLWLAPSEYESWIRAKKLVQANWFDEARAELGQLPDPQDPAGLMAFADLWAATLDYNKSTEFAAKAWAMDRKTIGSESLSIVYPKEFLGVIAVQAKRYKLQPEFVLSLIRQESQFRPSVESPAGALGLMQVLRSTSREIAKDLRIRAFNAEMDLRSPETNVRIGTNYIYRMIRAFDGHIPLALAAYNAGIGNMRAWMKARTDLNPDQLSKTDPDSEMWIDELPWLETTGYVRNILRNWIIYRYLDQSAEKFSFPIWIISP